MIWYVPEGVAAAAIDQDAVRIAVEHAFAALHRGEALTLPVAAGEGLSAGDRFAIKTARVERLIGAKFGAYWPGNRERGESAHGSTTILLDESTGRVKAIVGASALTAQRTAAADAAATDRLARPDARRLAVIGTGHQAWHDVRAVARLRPFEVIEVASRTSASAEAFAARLISAGYPARVSTVRAAVEAADVILCVTPASSVVVEDAWVRPGTHLSAMGADAAGKGELAPALVQRARLFADVIDQSVTIGEFRVAFESGLITRDTIGTLGALIEGAPGRRSAEEITIFDSSGTAVQDLAIAALAVERAVAAGSAVRLES